jgi:hypothetical protein
MAVLNCNCGGSYLILGHIKIQQKMLALSERINIQVMQPAQHLCVYLLGLHTFKESILSLAPAAEVCCARGVAELSRFLIPSA